MMSHSIPLHSRAPFPHKRQPISIYMWKRWSSPKLFTPPASDNTIVSHSQSTNSITSSIPVTTPEATATRDLQGGHSGVIKGLDQEGVHQITIKVHHNDKNSAVQQGDPIPDTSVKNCINTSTPEAIRPNILSVIDTTLPIMSSTTAQPHMRKRFTFNPFHPKPPSFPEKPNGNDNRKEKQAGLPPKFSQDEQDAFACAISIRTLAVPSSVQSSVNRAAQPPHDFNRIHHQMMNPRAAALIVNHLSRLPPPGDMSELPTIENVSTYAKSKPTRAVSLSMRDDEVDSLLLSRLRVSPKLRMEANEEPAQSTVGIHLASMTSILDSVKDLKVMSWFGFPAASEHTIVSEHATVSGHATASGNGTSKDSQHPSLFSIPGASSILTAGLQDIVKAVFDLGYATNELPRPDIKDVHPPTDRISILCYWWGYEICLPHQSMEYLSKVDSVVETLIRVLTAIAVVSAELRAVLPVVHFIASAIDAEWVAIKALDRGHGVVCTATWLMPVVLTTRSWDFTPPPGRADKATSP